MITNKVFMLTAIAGSLALVGCNGGGSGGSASTPVDIGGVAAKGALKNAKVTAYCGDETGVVLGSDTTGDGSSATKKAGAYSVKVSGDCAKPIKVVVKAQTGTLMVNELDPTKDIDVSGSNLQLRTYLESKPTASATNVHITPLTDAVAAVVDKAIADKTLTAPTTENISAAKTAVANTLLGGNAALLSVEPKTKIADAATDDEKKLTTLLAAVMASAPSQDAAGIAKAVEVLTAKVKDDVKLTANGYSAAGTATGAGLLTAAIAKVDPKLGIVPVNDVLTQKIEAGEVKIDNSKAAAVAEAKKLFAALKTDLLTLWNDAGSGFLNTKAAEMDADFKSIKRNGENLSQYLEAMMTGQTMVSEYDADFATKGNIHGWKTGTDQYGSYLLSGSGDTFQPHPSCKIYTSGQFAVSPTVARCFWADHDTIASITNGFTYKDHLLKIAAVAGQTGKFTWGNLPRDCTRTFVPVGTQGATTVCNQSQGSTELAGNITVPQSTSNGGISGTLSIKGDILPMLANATVTKLDILANGSSTHTSTATSETWKATLDTITGTVSSGPVTLSLLSGSKAQSTDTVSNGLELLTDMSVTLVLQAKTSAFQYDGTLSITGGETATTASTDSSFKGSLSKLTNGTAAAFFEGSIGVKGTAKRDANGNASLANAPATGTITGKVTNGSLVYNLDFSAVKDNTGATESTLTYTNPTGLKVTATGKDTGAATDTVKISSGTTAVVMKRDSTGEINSGTTKIGDVKKNKATFNDGTYILFL